MTLGGALIGLGVLAVAVVLIFAGVYAINSWEARHYRRDQEKGAVH